ncbi:hypothetical protein [Deinococcus hopiensis]|uniref:Uncharacterized protein n=1 Tax=Deinococcus hopiensis KR-140 TaxID=695939 RepID=A0A1W1VTT9_9DEIO|nr:hypothetical protein [Deinococcus hopiensis]SMB96304.1 hypothetical protein SAMN00790413_03248 [Deinococcus hopiensis KR-140]
MKVRFVSRRIRVRLDDLEVSALARGESQAVWVEWPGGGWRVTLDPGSKGVKGEGGALTVGLDGRIPELLTPENEGVTLPGPPRVDVEKDYGPQHG